MCQSDYDVCATCGSLKECPHDSEESETGLTAISESRSDIIQYTDIIYTYMKVFGSHRYCFWFRYCGRIITFISIISW